MYYVYKVKNGCPDELLFQTNDWHEAFEFSIGVSCVYITTKKLSK